MRVFVASALALLIAARVAHADDATARVTAVKKLFDGELAARIDDNDDSDKKFTATLAADALVDEQRDLMSPAKGTVAKPKVGWVGTCGWASAEASLRARTHPEAMVDPRVPAIQPGRPWHFLALLAPDGAAIKFKALAWFVTTPDKELADGHFNDIDKLAVDASAPPLRAWLAKPSEMAKHLANDPAVTVFGTSASDHAYGPAAAKKLLASWAKLKLEVVNKDKPNDDETNREVSVGDCTATFANVRMQTKEGGILLHALAIAHKVGDAWEVVAMAYATDRAY